MLLSPSFFKRTEKKYLITTHQAEALLHRLRGCLQPDRYGESTVCSLYLDTPDFRMIRASMDARTYKEKLRVRCYGTTTADSTAFLEIKKKFDGVVYKRREAMPLATAMAYLQGSPPPLDTQIMREIDYAMHFWQHPQPSAVIAYERRAFFFRETPSVRLTLDANVRYRTNRLDLALGHEGQIILPAETVLLEIKSDGAMPLVLAHTLDALHIFPSSFSKYGTAYLAFSHTVPPHIDQNEAKGAFCYA